MLREPLVHFLVLGALLFGFSSLGPGSDRVVVTSGQVDLLVANYTRTWQRPPTQAERAALIRDHVHEEVAVREAMALGLDRDDSIVRRRLRQKFDYLLEEAVDTAPPTNAQLQAWLEAHPERFRLAGAVAFRQVLLRDETQARTLLPLLEAAGPEAELSAWGGMTMLPQEVDLSTPEEIGRLFGPDFATALLAVEPGRWAGPLASGYGVHLVLVREREEAGVPALSAIRAQVEQEFLAERRAEAKTAAYDELLDRYRVVVEK